MVETKAYDAEFYNDQCNGSLNSAKIILPLVLKILPKINSAVDLGCGRGTWLSVLKELGVDEIKGYDGQWVESDMLLIPEHCFTPAELDKKMTFERKYDLAISLEVAEHLPEESAKEFIKTLTTASNIVLFSAAIPHQGGVNHINEQWQKYWHTLFASMGYIGIDCLRNMIWDNPEIDWWYRQNIILYIHREILQNTDMYKGYDKKNKQMNLVHPELYLKTINLLDDASIYTMPLRTLYKIGARRTIKKIFGGIFGNGKKILK
jgi:SAM-dependent methyltransferase